MPSSRTQLKEYCLRNLGAPVLEINVDDDQLEDRIDEALQYWHIYHHEGVAKTHLKHQVLRSTIDVNDLTGIVVGDIITGGTSNATAVVVGILPTDDQFLTQGGTLVVRDVEGEFVAAAQVAAPPESFTTTGGAGNITAVRLTGYDTGFVELPDYIYGVTKIIPFARNTSSGASARSDSRLFSPEFQLRAQEIWNIQSTQIMYYKQSMSHLDLIEHELNAKPSFEFNRLQNRLYPNINWEYEFTPGDYMILACYRAVDPDDFSKVWDEPWLKRYVTGLFKRQWGQNLSKFSGIQLPGGVTLDGPAIYQQAVEEIKELEQELIDRSAPLEFFMG